jgi:2-polyprenyl-6-methoxyphenol hydroxylase-like FAD-dependent oxidoreductase
MSKPGRILIVGGGIAGLTLAAALWRHGYEAELIERNSQWEPVGGGIAVQPNAMRVLNGLGIGAAVQQSGTIVRRWQFLDQQGDLLCDIALEPLWNGVGPFVGIERTKLHDALRSGAAAACRLGTWVTSLRQDRRRVLVAFNDATSGEYDLVVGADGIHSSMRELMLGPTAPVYGGQMVWRSLVSIRPPNLDGVQFWLGDGMFFGLCPVGAGTYGFANFTTPRLHDPTEGRLHRLRNCFIGFGGAVRDYLDALETDEQIHCGPIEWLEIERWHRGHVILIGDAAHASSPMMGQGGSMAMEDALVLAEILRSTPQVETAIEMFVVRRKQRVDWVQQQSRAVGELLRMPPTRRNSALRERGQSAFYDRFQPLTAMP